MSTHQSRLMSTHQQGSWSRVALAVVAALACAGILLLVRAAPAEAERAGTVRQALPAAGGLYLYEGDNATQDRLCVIPFEYGKTVNLTNDNLGCENDEARSVSVEFVPPGASFTVHDSPSCSWSDDTSAITITDPDAYNARIVVPRFNYTGGTDRFNIAYYRDNGIQGKVSCIRMNSP